MKSLRIISLLLWVLGIIAWFTMPWFSLGVESVDFAEVGVTAYGLVTNSAILDSVSLGSTWGNAMFLTLAPCYLSALILLIGFISVLGRKPSIDPFSSAVGAFMLLGFGMLVNQNGHFTFLLEFDLSCPGPILIGCLFAVQFVLALIMKRMAPQENTTPPKAVTPPAPSTIRYPNNPAPSTQTPVSVAAQPTTAPASSKPQETHVESTQTDTYWICSACHTKNLNQRNDCWSCGTQK